MTLRTVGPSAFLATIAALALAAGDPRPANGLGAQPIDRALRSSRVHAARPGVASPLVLSRLARVRSADSVQLYTEEQATAGGEVFAKTCTECHEKADVTSGDFKTKWGGRPLLDLFELVRTTMPDGNPGALSRTEYANVMAYVLKLNGLPAGPTAVMPDSAAMSAATVVFPAGGG